MKGIRDERGFTLVELIVIIIILGILSVVAIPKYLDLRAEAEKGVAKGVTGALRGSIAIQHARYLIGGAVYAIGDVVSGVGTEDITLASAGTRITATFPSANTYSWSYTARSGDTAAKVAPSGW
jgi:prepilin-type N-terminal cleavage/methylation domain-containing protein